MIPLSHETRIRVERLFHDADGKRAEALLEDACGDDLPLTDDISDDFHDRVRFAVLRLSGGRLNRLEREVERARRDWRDTLIAAGFKSPDAHRDWMPAGSTSQSR